MWFGFSSFPSLGLWICCWLWATHLEKSSKLDDCLEITALFAQVMGCHVRVAGAAPGRFSAAEEAKHRCGETAVGAGARIAWPAAELSSLWFQHGSLGGKRLAPEVNGRKNYNWRCMETLETCEAKMQQSKECCIILYFYQLRPFQCWNRFNELIFCVMFQRCTGSAVSAIRIAWQMLAGRGSWSRPRCRRESYNKVNISYDKDKKE